MSELLDIESVRSKYADLTVTAVPSIKPAVQPPDPQQYRVEITRVPIPAPISKSVNPKIDTKFDVGTIQNGVPAMPSAVSTSAAYAREYAAIISKLEYTKLMQAQLAIMQQPVTKYPEQQQLNNVGSMNLVSTGFGLDPNMDIASTYDNLLSVIASMRENIGPSYLGTRCPKERLLRDIAQARVLVRECQLLIEREEAKDNSVFML